MQVAFYLAGEITQVLELYPGSVVPLAMFFHIRSTGSSKVRATGSDLLPISEGRESQEED